MKKLVLTIILTTMVCGVYSQKRVIYGKVDYVNYPVMNVVVTAKKAQSSVTTDSLGSFVIACEKNDVLLFESENFFPAKKRIKYIDSLNVHLTLKPGIINEQGVVLNSYMSSEAFNRALAEVENEKNDFLRYTDIFQLIKAKFPYVEVTSEGVITRGRSSINLSNCAIYVVNGTVVGTINHIIPSQIESIKILTSTEGVARYGGDAKNGVIEIVTKSNASKY